MDIPLAEEDSSDEEYRPDEEEEDETAEDVRLRSDWLHFHTVCVDVLIIDGWLCVQTFQESDMESTASSPRGSRLTRVEEDSCSPWQVTERDGNILTCRDERVHVQVCVCVCERHPLNYQFSKTHSR